MSKNPRQSNIVELGPPPLSEEQIRLIAKRNKISLSTELVAEISEILNRYMSFDRQFFSNIPRSVEVKSNLTRLKKAADNFHNALENLDFVSRELLISQSEWLEIEKTRDNAGLAAMAATAAIEHLDSLPHKTGRPKQNFALECLIKDLIDFYEKSTSKKAKLSYMPAEQSFGGPLYRIIFAFLGSVAPGDVWSNQSLGHIIRNVLKNRQK